MVIKFLLLTFYNMAFTSAHYVDPGVCEIDW